MNKLSFDAAAAELAKLHTSAEPHYASFLTRRIFDLIRETYVTAFKFEGFPEEVAREMALVQAYKVTGRAA
jgi:uncharacterized protein (DUF3820 family)